MTVSNRIKRNISFVLTIIGCSIILARIIGPIMNQSISGRNWFEIFGAIVITWCAFSNFSIYRKRVKDGIIFGSR